MTVSATSNEQGQDSRKSTRRWCAIALLLASCYPVLIAIGVGMAMTFLATRTRLGRYVYAIGGNPEAAELAGVNTRWVIEILLGRDVP